VQESKKLLHVLYSGQGGLGTYFMNFVNSDKENRFEHFAFFYGIEPLLDEYRSFCEINGIPYAYVKRSGKVDFKALMQLKKFGTQNRVRYLFLHTFSLSLIHLVAPLSFKVIAVDHTPTRVKKSIEKVYTVLNHLLSFKTVYFYRGHFEEMKSYFPLAVSRKKCTIIPKSVDIHSFHPAERSEQLRESFTLGITARIIEGKRHDLLIEAMSSLVKQNMSVKLKIAGDGPLKLELEREVAMLALESNVEFTGRLTQEGLLAFYQSLDAYIHATDGETICYCIMEAQACGLPILASNVKGVNNILSNETGILFNNTVDNIKGSIDKVMADNELRLDLCSKSRALAEMNSRNNNSSRMLYESLFRAS